MFSGKTKFIFSIFFVLFFSSQIRSQTNSSLNKDLESLDKGIQLLRRYFTQQNTWHVIRPDLADDVNGLIHFIEDDPIDSILMNMSNADDSISDFVYRLPENVQDSLNVPGYYPHQKLEKDIQQIDQRLQNEFQEKEIRVPRYLFENIEEKVNLLIPGDGVKLFTDSIYIMPDSLAIPEVIPDSVLQSERAFNNLLRIDSLRILYVEQKRLEYNDSIINAYKDSVAFSYKQEKFNEEYLLRKKLLVDSVRLNNYYVLKNYNDSVIHAVNDSIFKVIQVLSEYANYIDTTKFHMKNLVGDESSLVLSDYNQNFARIWLKNQQNDSLSVLVKNVDKNAIQLFIDDGVTFSRFKARETRDFDFSTLNTTVAGLSGISQRYEVKTPWRIGGDGNAGFTQTYLENWKKGGKSALSMLMVLKGFANYSSENNKIKWENSGELRNGWIRQGGEESETQKNDDKFELTSRFGVSAFKKWFYSAEFNYETQLFRGYRYPKSENPDPISTFMAPARTFFKLGLDYKPNKDFSLFLSPLTAKNVFVRDTALIDQTKFGVDADKRSFWEPGLNADLKYKTQLTPDISYETKYKMFINYNKPFTKFDINWENHLVMQLNDHINFRMMLHLIYDDDVLFPIEDADGNKIGEEPKLQVKELLTIGFSYKINRVVTRTRRLH